MHFFNIYNVKQGCLTHSKGDFSNRLKQELINQISKNSFLEDEQTPYILVREPSTAALVEKPILVEEPVGLNSNLISPIFHNARFTGYPAIKINSLKDKQLRDDSHKNFLTRLLEAKITSKNLALDLEPTIVKHEQKFLDNWN